MEDMAVECGGMGFMMLVPLALTVWFFIFSIIVLVKLGKIGDKLDKK